MSALAGVHDKLAEAMFFLALLKRIESGQPVTDEPLDSEATYFLSALLCACFSVLEYLKKQGLGDAVTKMYRQNPDLYSRPKKRSSDTKGYGLRHLSVHHKPVGVEHHDRTLGTLGSVPLGRLPLGAIRRERHLYTDDPHSDAHVRIVKRMREHVRDLEALVTRWEDSIDSKPL